MNWIVGHWKSLTATAAVIAFFVFMFIHPMITLGILGGAVVILGISAIFVCFCDGFGE